METQQSGPWPAGIVSAPNGVVTVSKSVQLECLKHFETPYKNFLAKDVFTNINMMLASIYKATGGRVGITLGVVACAVNSVGTIP
ncbi:hypothetical protein NBRC116587_20150 [Pseudoteredinibacter isoporae]